MALDPNTPIPGPVSPGPQDGGVPWSVAAPTTAAQVPFAGFHYAYKESAIASELPMSGAKSLFNEYSVFRFNTSGANFNMLYDVEGRAGVTPFESRNPSAQSIIRWATENGPDSIAGRTPYSYSDFLYCTYHSLIPNNYLVTLRRFPTPTTDGLQEKGSGRVPPVAQAVTWFGEETGNPLKDILKFACGLNWEEIAASVQEVEGNERPGAEGPLQNNKLVGGIQAFLNPNEYSGLAAEQTDYAKRQYGSEGPYANRAYGPINVVDKTMLRKQGLHFAHEMSLNFHYSLRSISNINPKMAMLDIIANMLTLTYNNAKFWGGAIRYFPQHPGQPFLGDQKAFDSGDVGGYIDSLGKSFAGMGESMKGLLDGFFTGNPMDALKKLMAGGAKQFMGAKAAQNRPKILAFRSLLTGASIGEWHLVVGNPMNPIAMIGNLICTDVEFEFSDELGADDFPNEMKVTIKLNHGRPRDKGDIESMFNLGSGRLYYGINDDAIFSSTKNSEVSAANKGSKPGDNKGLITDQHTDKNANVKATPEDHRAASTKDFSTKNSMWGNKFSSAEAYVTGKWTNDAPPSAPK